MKSFSNAKGPTFQIKLEGNDFQFNILAYYLEIIRAALTELQILISNSFDGSGIKFKLTALLRVLSYVETVLFFPYTFSSFYVFKTRDEIRLTLTL